LFEAQSNFHLDLKAANEFEVTDEALSEVFVERGVPSATYGPLFIGEFKPYIPSNNILSKFNKIAERTGVDPMEQALPILEKMIDAFQSIPLGEPFNFKLEDFGIQKEQDQSTQSSDPRQSSLDTPGVNPANFNTATMDQGTIGTTGLTSTEQALLSPEEQAIRLRQRGQA